MERLDDLADPDAAHERLRVRRSRQHHARPTLQPQLARRQLVTRRVRWHTAPMLDARTPVLVGCGDVTDLTTPVHAGRSPYDLIAAAARQALAASIDTVVMLRSFADTSYRFASELGTSTNPPKSVADRVGLNASRHLYTWNGGN